MPLCGFSPKMLKGLTMFAEGLYEAALRRAREEESSIETAMEKEIGEMNVFLAALDERYNELRRTQRVDDAMRNLVRWAETGRR